MSKDRCCRAFYDLAVRQVETVRLSFWFNFTKKENLECRIYDLQISALSSTYLSNQRLEAKT